MARISRQVGLVGLIGLVLTSLTSPAAWAGGKPGEAGFLSLRMPVGARESAMGGAGVAASSGAAAIFWNPANLAYAPLGTDLLLQHQRMYGLFSKENVLLAHRTSLGVFGLAFSGFYSDAIDRHSDRADVFEGTFKPYDVSFGLSYAREVAHGVAVGATAKMVYQRIDIYDDTGLAFDLFLSHRTVIEGLRFGASLTNLGGRMNLKSQPFDLPRALRIGAAFDPQQAFLARKVTLTADVISPNDGNTKAHAGLEYRLRPELSLRIGSAVNYDSRGLTAGAGFRVRNMELAYAFEDYRNELEPTHKFALEMNY